jgi:hypothetical protein
MIRDVATWDPRPRGHPEHFDRWLDVPLFLALRMVKP